MTPALRAGKVARSLFWAWLAVLPGCALLAGEGGPGGVIEFAVPTSRGPLPVRAYVPGESTSATPVWVVMHGQRRDAQAYFATWLEHARANRALLVVPEFDKAKWPKSTDYQLGNVMTRQGTAVPREEWAFSAVDRAVDEILRRTGRSRAAARVALFGHGAGAQFVQRYVLHTGATGVSVAVAANAGWYLLPEDSFDFPYGLRRAPIDADVLRKAFAAPLVVLVGQADLREDGVIRRNAQADAQGTDRLSRGRFFIERARAAAAGLGVPLRWRLQEVPGAGHRDEAMMPAAIELLKAATTDPG